MSDPREGWTSASAAEYDSLCSGRHLAQRDIPDSPSSGSEFGTTVHAAYDGQDVELNLTQERLLERAGERERQVLEMYGGIESYEQHNEIRLWADIDDLKHSGQADRLFLPKSDNSLDRIIVEDLKSLRGSIPESSQNQQLRDLAVLAWRNFTCKSVVVFINQPMARSDQSVTVYNSRQLYRAWTRLKIRVISSNDHAAKRVAGEVQCKFCRARGVCPEAVHWATHALGVVPPAKPKISALVAAMTPQKLAYVFRQAPAIESVLEAVRQRLLAIPDEDLAEIGLLRTPGHFRESITDTQELFNRLISSDLELRHVIKALKMGKKDLESLLREHKGLSGNALGTEIHRLIDGIAERKQNAPSLGWIKPQIDAKMDHT